MPRKTRIEVLRLAERGAGHPDATTDTAAVQYAQMVLEPPSFPYTPAFQFVVGLALFGVALLAGDAFLHWTAGIGGGLGMLLALYSWDQIRDARKILSVPRTTHTPEAS